MKSLILTEYSGGSNARLEFWEKDGRGLWQRKMECAAVLGKNGVGKEREGDEKTPLGDFGLICSFGIKADPGARLPYIRIDADTWCCGDRVAYNRIIDLRQFPHECKGERMAEYVPEYNYGIFPDYNAGGTPGLGFAIFLHCRGEKEHTGGCIAVDEGEMIRLLQMSGSDTRLCVF